MNVKGTGTNDYACGFIVRLYLIENNIVILFNRCDNIRGNGTRKRSIHGIRKFRTRRRSDSDASQDSSLETSIEDDEEEINENMDEDEDDDSDIKNVSNECNLDIGSVNRIRNPNKVNLASQQSTYKLRDSRFIIIMYLLAIITIVISIIYNIKKNHTFLLKICL